MRDYDSSLKLEIKHKLALAFVSVISLVLILGLFIDLAVRRYDQAVKGISQAGWEIRTAKEVLNSAREMRIILLAVPVKTTETRTRRLLAATQA